jgi:hypothetical protein
MAVPRRRPPLTRVGLSWICLESLVRIKRFSGLRGLSRAAIFVARERRRNGDCVVMG